MTPRLVLILLIAILAPNSVTARTLPEARTTKDFSDELSTVEIKATCRVSHRVGKLVLAVSNLGILAGEEMFLGWVDDITGEENKSAEYPKGSNVLYAYACAFWIGGAAGGDTLVSTGDDGWIPFPASNEFLPAMVGLGEIIYRSIRFPERPDLLEGAVSEEDFIAVYSDTAVRPSQETWDGLPHRPLSIEVTQRSYAWSYAYAEDFILFDFDIKNIGFSSLKNIYMGFYNDSDVGFAGNDERFADDICGFRRTFPAVYDNVCIFEDTVNCAWIADNDGDPDTSSGAYTDVSCPAVTGMRVIRTPADKLNVSFNWWVSNEDPLKDFGPRERSGVGVWSEEFRDFGTGGTGTPEGDYNKYYMLRNQEFDFDQVFTYSILPNDSIWTYPPQEEADDVSRGYDTRYLLSFGPFDIDPGENLPITFAYIAAENFHRDPTNVDYLPYNPTAYYNGLDFTDLALNSTWASLIYDNPGVDTDNSGYAGKVRICCSDGRDTSCYRIEDVEEIEWYSPLTCRVIPYEGDGVPDFRGASPPPPPYVSVEPSIGSIRVRFNGTRSETTADVFSRVIDFEGYRVHIARDSREGSFSVLASYDIEDYNKYIYNPNKMPEPGWELRDVPYTVDSLKALYGEQFDPEDYPQESPYEYTDASIDPPTTYLFYFAPQDFNASELGVTTKIRKVYQKEIEDGILTYPTVLDPAGADPEELTEEGYFKYFEYELVIDSLLPTVEWWIAVTTFDFGSPESGLKSLETSKAIGAIAAYPLSSHDDVVNGNKKVFVYPNPYRSDADYRDLGFEGRLETDRPVDRTRELHFANLPPKCTIRIYSLDGDLIRELTHDKDPSDPECIHDTWDLITRNTQMIVSGLYYWTVESDNGETQIGKFVVIM